MTDTTRYLRAETEAAMKAALPWAVQQDDEPEGRSAGEWIAQTDQYWLLIIGSPLCIKDAVYGDPDPDPGEPTIAEPAQWDTGYHANLYTGPDFPHDVPESMVVHPENPRRVRA